MVMIVCFATHKGFDVSVTSILTFLGCIFWFINFETPFPLTILSVFSVLSLRDASFCLHYFSHAWVMFSRNLIIICQFSNFFPPFNICLMNWEVYISSLLANNLLWVSLLENIIWLFAIRHAHCMSLTSCSYTSFGCRIHLLQSQ